MSTNKSIGGSNDKGERSVNGVVSKITNPDLEQKIKELREEIKQLHESMDYDEESHFLLKENQDLQQKLKKIEEIVRYCVDGISIIELDSILENNE